MELVNHLSLSFIKNTMEFFEASKIRLSPRFFTYYPSHTISIETKNYELKTADSLSELVEVFKLRFQNFLENVDASAAYAFDVDEFDHLCDHLIIKCKKTSEVIGTYRILCSRYTSSFYSQNEFVMDDFIKEKGVKLELGRVCIDTAHRNGHVIDLLWKGIGKYAGLTNAKFLFGCSSVHTTDVQKSQKILDELKLKEALGHEYDIYPQNKYCVDEGNDRMCDYVYLNEEESLIPSLLKSYLKAGAKVFGKPALDREFECFDYMTILNLDSLTKLFKRRYFSYESLS